MNITVRRYCAEDIDQMMDIWNGIVLEGNAFPQEEPLDRQGAVSFFAAQTYTAVAVDEEGAVCGLYILHPNNVGRCGHICNASYGVRRDLRGMRIGERLVRDCMEMGREHGFSILQFNAVVATNARARHLYEQLGFVQLGIIPKGFRTKNGSYEDICPYYRQL